MKENKKMIDLEDNLLEENELSNTEIADKKTETDLFDDDLLEGEGVKSLKEIKKKIDRGFINNKLFGFTAFLFFLIFLIAYGSYYFFKLSLEEKQVSGYDKQFLEIVDNYILKYISDSISNNQNISFSISSKPLKEAQKIKKVINDKSVFFYKKKEAILNLENNIKSNISSNLSSINSIKQYLINYRYLPKEIEKLVKDIKITPILMTINAIKIYILDDTYIKMGTFDEQILQDVRNKYANTNDEITGITWSQLGRYIMEDITNLRELGVKTYLRDIKFNYMYFPSNTNDDFITNFFANDFISKHSKVLENRYNYLKAHYPRFNLSKDKFYSSYTKYIKSVYELTDKQLSNRQISKFLPINIKLLDYDPKTQKLSFNVKLNIKDNINGRESKVTILDLAKNIVNLLRESRLIIGSDINLNNINIQVNKLRTPNGTVTYNTTTLIFRTSVQKEENVEVIDTNKK